MNVDKIIKETKVIIITTLLVGMVLLVTGISFDLLDIHIIDNNRAIVGSSFLPLSVAFVYYLKLRQIKKSPQKMRKFLVNESDERIVALKNEVDAKALKITQAALILAYMMYTLMVPKDIFESPGWWILLLILFVSFVSQGIIHTRVSKQSGSEKN